MLLNKILCPVDFSDATPFGLRPAISLATQYGAEIIFWIARANPFTYVIELIRFALYGEFNGLAFAVVLASLVVFFVLAVQGYDPQRGLLRRVQRPGPA